MAFIDRILRPLGLRITRIQQSKQGSDPQWYEERIYWFEVFKEFYRKHYGLEIDPAQTDPQMVPPLELALKIQLANKADANAFFASGYRASIAYHQELLDYGAALPEMKNILEIGVGLGRLILHYYPFGANLYGCDITPEVIDWVQVHHGKRVHVILTHSRPPLPYDNEQFDFIYANSVFTHIPCELVPDWVEELQRILRPGGMCIVSVFDANHYFNSLSYREFHRKYECAGCYSWGEEKGVHMSTFLSRDYLRKTWSKHFKVLELRSHYREQSHLICRKEK